MGILYFEDRFNNKRVVKENIAENEVYSAITEYVHFRNPDYKIYYMRSWKAENGDIRYDVGSHVEFFIYEPAE